VNGIFFTRACCCAGSRLLFRKGSPILSSKIERQNGNAHRRRPADKNTDIGAINSKINWTKSRNVHKDRVDEGAELHQSSAPFRAKDTSASRRYSCTHRNPTAWCRKKFFGPVLAVQTFRTVEEAVKKRTTSLTGFPQGFGRIKAQRFSISLPDAGRSRMGEYVQQFDPASPFGGYKRAGSGAKGACTASSLFESVK